MYLSKISHPDFTTQKPDEREYDMHKLVWSLFQFQPYYKDRKFIFSFFERNIFIVSEEKPTPLKNSDLKIETKNYDMNFVNGKILSFDIKINAQITRNHKKLPIMTAYANDLREKGKTYTLNEVAEKSVKDWFSNHENSLGFRILEFTVVSFYNHKFKKNDGKKVTYNTIDLKGILQINHPGLFLKSLYQGIGKSRAFGCGMLLIRPVAIVI